MELRFTEETDPAFRALADRCGGSASGLACAAVILEDGEAIACAGWRAADAVTAGLCCLYVQENSRRRGAARRLITALEAHAAASGCHRMTAPDGDEGLARCLAALGYTKTDEPAAAWEHTVSDGTMR